MSTLITSLLASTGISLWVLLVVYILFFPQKIEILSSWLWKGLSKIKAFGGFAHRQYVKYDLQGRLNDYVMKVQKQAPYLAGSRFKVEYTERNLTKKGFFENGQVILRVRRDDPQETNFVHVAYWAVATGLLFKTKRYISPSQGEAVDLYFTTRLFEEEKPSVVDIFLDKYLHPKIADTNSKVARYYDEYAKIDERGYFYPVYLQELDYLGAKVFGRRKDDLIIKEVNGLIQYLKSVAQRKIGDDETDLCLVGRYLRVAIMIVGKGPNLTPEGNIYVNFVRNELMPKGVETLYVLGRYENRDIIDNVCAALDDTYERSRMRKSPVMVQKGDKELSIEQYLVVLRRKGIKVYQPSE